MLARAPGGTLRPTLVAAMRDLRAGGGFNGALIAVLPISDVAPAVEDGALPQGAAVAVTDETGALLSATDRRAFPIA